MDHQPYICGRCGYDLQGIIDSWGDENTCSAGAACPLEGQCSECGSVFQWRDIFHIERLNKRWLAEHANSRWGLVKRIPLTAAMAVLPWFFWRRLSMQAKVDLRRAVVASLVLIALLHMGVGGYLTAKEIQGEYRRFFWFSTRAGVPVAPLGLSSSPQIAAKVILGEYVYIELKPATVPSDTDATLALPRGGGIGIAKHSKLKATYTSGQGPPLIILGLTLNLAWLGLMGVLPTTRALAKLRWAQITRAGVYGLAGSAVFAEFIRIAVYVEGNLGSGFVLPISVLLGVGWITLWWCSAIVFGWRLKHPWAVAGLFTLISFLVMLLVIAAIVIVAA